MEFAQCLKHVSVLSTCLCRRCGTFFFLFSPAVSAHFGFCAHETPRSMKSGTRGSPYVRYVHVRLMIQDTFRSGGVAPRRLRRPFDASERGINLNEIHRLCLAHWKGAFCWDCSILNYWILWIYPATRTQDSYIFFKGIPLHLHLGTEHPGWGGTSNVYCFPACYVSQWKVGRTAKRIPEWALYKVGSQMYGVISYRGCNSLYHWYGTTLYSPFPIYRVRREVYVLINLDLLIQSWTYSTTDGANDLLSCSIQLFIFTSVSGRLKLLPRMTRVMLVKAEVEAWFVQLFVVGSFMKLRYLPLSHDGTGIYRRRAKNSSRKLTWTLIKYLDFNFWRQLSGWFSV